MPEEQAVPQLTLPYKELTSLAGRKDLRDCELIKQSTKVSYTIPFNEIKIRDGFNQRDEYEDIPGLADSLLEHGQLTEFDLDVEKLEDGSLVFYIFRGHRRHQAYLLNVQRGEFDPKERVRFFPTPSSTTELFRMVDQYVSNHHQKKFSLLAQSSVAFHIKNNFGEKKSHDEVAKLMGISRQKVDQLIKIAESSDDIKNQIKMAEMGITDAVSLINRQKQLKKQADKKETESHKNEAPPTPDPIDPMSKEVAELKQLDEQAEHEKEVREQNKREQDLEQLLIIANEVACEWDLLQEQEGKQLAADVYRILTKDMVNENTGEVIPFDAREVAIPKGTPLDADTIKAIMENLNVEKVYVYKTNPTVKSVITVEPEIREKSKYDEARPEMAAIQGAIKCFDKLAAIAEKIPGVNEQTLKDIAYNVHWGQANLSEAREWMHNNKKQNKKDH